MLRLAAFALAVSIASPALADLACPSQKPSLAFCRREVNRVQAYLDRMNKRAERTGRGFAAGSSIGGCAAECKDLYPALQDKNE